LTFRVGLAILTIIMGYLGVHLTMHPAESPHQRKFFKIAFCSCALVMVSLVVWQSVRNADGQSALRGRITDLQSKVSHTHIRFDTNAIAIAVDDPTQFKVPPTLADIFTANGKAEFNVDYRNVGVSNSTHTGATGNVLVTETKPDLDEAFSVLDHNFRPGRTGDELVPQDHRFFTANSRALSASDIDRLNHGKMGLYLVAMVKFSDSTGDYQQEFCGWLQLPLPSRQLVWHSCGAHDSEKRLAR
jgi:hypothetical protein